MQTNRIFLVTQLHQLVVGDLKLKLIRTQALVAVLAYLEEHLDLGGKSTERLVMREVHPLKRHLDDGFGIDIGEELHLDLLRNELHPLLCMQVERTPHGIGHVAPLRIVRIGSSNRIEHSDWGIHLYRVWTEKGISQKVGLCRSHLSLQPHRHPFGLGPGIVEIEGIGFD